METQPDWVSEVGGGGWGGLHSRKGRNSSRLLHANLALLVVAFVGPPSACRFSPEKHTAAGAFALDFGCVMGEGGPTTSLTLERMPM